MDENQTNPRKQRAGGRRTLLLACLLAALVALLTMRPGLREPAGRLVTSASRYLIHDVAGVSPRTLYAWRLWAAGLGDSPLARRWRDAVVDATPERFTSHEHATLRFAADTVTARVFVTHLDRGEAVIWQLRRPRDATGTLDATLEYRADAMHAWQTLAALDADGATHRHVAGAAGDYRFVFQPELFAQVTAHWAAATGGSIPMPVVGAHTYDIGGGFGAPRDGGRRRHEGIDIFAKRGTPVRAVVDGRVSRRNGGLGGHAIFLSSGFTGPRYYYAHLNAYKVADGAEVHRGEIIGTVGNSGNAAGGPTHLHFGIYTASGAIDPAPFVQPMPTLR